MNTFLKVVVVIFGVTVVAMLGLLIFVSPAKGPTITPQPISSDGHLQVSLPLANASVSSPLAVEGTVIDGGWFFEGNFSIKVLDGDGTTLGVGLAQALSDWMSTGTVPFSASIPFKTPHSATGTIVLVADNPSGLAANAKSLTIPITFGK